MSLLNDVISGSYSYPTSSSVLVGGFSYSVNPFVVNGTVETTLLVGNPAYYSAWDVSFNSNSVTLTMVLAPLTDVSYSADPFNGPVFTVLSGNSFGSVTGLMVNNPDCVPCNPITAYVSGNSLFINWEGAGGKVGDSITIDFAPAPTITVSSGQTYNVSSGQIDTGDIVLSGGTLDVLSGGTANGTTIYAGGSETVSAGGIDHGALISGGTQYDYGSAIGDTIFTGSQVVEKRGTASGTIVDRGGFEYVSSLGTASGTTINGGTMEVAKDGSTGSGAITFTSAGGDLQLDASQSFQGLIAGFGSPHGVTEEIDLRDIAFGAHTKVTFTEDNHHSGTLTVTDGTHTANLTLLGQYSTAMFSLSSDGHGGTMITDQPAMAGSAANLVLAAHV